MTKPFHVCSLPEPGPEWAQARKRARLSQASLARKVGVTTRTIQYLERPGTGVTVAIRKGVAIELWVALGWRCDPFTLTQEVSPHA